MKAALVTPLWYDNEFDADGGGGGGDSGVSGRRAGSVGPAELSGVVAAVSRSLTRLGGGDPTTVSQSATV